jgi:hypothetical protein
MVPIRMDREEMAPFFTPSAGLQCDKPLLSGSDPDLGYRWVPILHGVRLMDTVFKVL